jgi:hypothetical protein
MDCKSKTEGLVNMMKDVTRNTQWAHAKTSFIGTLPHASTFQGSTEH